MERVLRVFLRGDTGDAMVRMIEARRQTSHPYSRAVVDGIAGFTSVEERLSGSITKTVSTRLQIWSNPRVAAATNATDFDLREIRRQPMSIYIGVAPGDIARVAPLLRLFFDAVLNVNTSKTPQQDQGLRIPTLLLMDEFAQLGRMDRLAHALQYARGYGLRFALVVQNRAQIMDTYGSYAASDIFDNVGVEMVYGTGDEKLAKQLEERLGDTTMNVVTHNRPRWFAWANPSRQTEAEHPHRRPLMLASEIMQMPQDEQLILRTGMKPIRAKKIRWWQEPELVDRQTPAPAIPELEVLIAMDDGSRLSRPRQEAPRAAR